jgi:phosphoribosyl-AMP cyclohydrolase
VEERCGRRADRPGAQHQGTGERVPVTDLNGDTVLRTQELPTVSDYLDPAVAARLRRDPAGLVPAIVQEHGTGEVLMLAWMNDQALHRTLTTGRATYWSRSRGEFWVKGETSGHHQYVRSVKLDCDGDALLLTVEQVGPACHTGKHTCFFTTLETSP